jgi:hypothetical protein
MHFIDGIKRQLHRDIVADPVLHGRVLNLYLNGEDYPHRVTDYFPVAYVEAPELAARMRAHMADEDKHIVLYGKAIDKLGQAVEDLPHAHIYNAVVRHHTPASWRVLETHDRETRRAKLAHFFAHAHWLEKRVAVSLEYHLEACAQAAHSPYVEKAVSVVLADEHRHVAYTAEAAKELLPAAEVREIWRLHQQAERRGNLDFSASQLKRLLREDRDHWPAARRGLYRACALAMRGLLNL